MHHLPAQFAQYYRIVNMCDIEKLIEKVSQKPILYDLSHPEYKNIKKKDKIWDEMVVCMKIESGDDLKKKWKNLRDSYIKYLRSEKTKNEQEMKILGRYKMWPWAQKMEFMRPSLLFAKTYSNISSTQSEPVSKLIEESSQQSIEPNQSPAENYLSNEIDPALIDENQERKKRKQQPIDKNELKKKKEDILNPPQSSVEQDISFLRGKSIEDDIDDIFKGYAKTIKKFSKKRQAITKFKLSQIIMEQELEHIEEEEQHGRNIGTAISATSRPDTAQSSILEACVLTPHASSSPSPHIDQPSSNEQSYSLPIHCRKFKTETLNSYSDNLD